MTDDRRTTDKTNRPFSADVTSCFLINQQCWIARIFSQNIMYEILRWYLKFDYNSLLYSRVTHHWVPSISHRECTRGGQLLPPPLVHSLWEIDRIRWLIPPIPNKLLWSNWRYHLSTSYSTFWEKIRAIQHCWLISEQAVTGSDIRRKMVYCLTPIVHIRRGVIISVSHLSCQEKAHTCSNQFSSSNTM